MKQFRVTRIQVLIAGLVVIVGVAVAFLFAFIRPQTAEIGKINAGAKEREDWARANGPKAQRELEAARQQEAVIKASFDQIMKMYMPDIDLSDPIGGMIRLWSFPREEGLLIDKWFRSSGAEVSGYSFPGYGTQPPNPAQKILGPWSWNLSVQVRDFASLLKWLEKLPTAPRFMVMQSVTIGGPRQPGQPLNASVPVVLYEWTKAAQTALQTPVVAPAAVGETGGAGAGPAAGGGRGGGRGMRGGRGGGGGGRGMRGGGGGGRGGGRGGRGGG